MPLNSVTTIQFLNKNASYDDKVLDIIRHAEGIFFEGAKLTAPITLTSLP